MGCPGVGPCEVWDLDLSCCLTVSASIPDPCLLDDEPVPPHIIENAELIASQLLWAATGRQFGICTVKIRPCRACPDECCLPWMGDGFYSVQSTLGGLPFFPSKQPDGSWINLSCPCQTKCSCKNLCEINLPYPVCSVDEILIDGEVVDPTTYKVYEFERLIRTNEDCWPRCNDLTKPDTEEGTWSVTLTYGNPIPALVLMGAAEFACEIIKDCVGKPCRLPQRVSSITRQGVSVSFLDEMSFLERGMTGLYFTDLAIRQYNPRGLQKRPTVYSPDIAHKWTIET